MKRLIADNTILFSQKRTAWLLLVLFSVFAFRVVSQLIVSFSSIPYFPDFDMWHSDVVPYKVLFMSQLLILLAGIWIVWCFFRVEVVKKPGVGIILYLFGWLYWIVMFLRLLLGMTIFKDIHWFGQILPTLFHLILANVLMLVGDFHRNRRNSI